MSKRTKKTQASAEETKSEASEPKMGAGLFLQRNPQTDKGIEALIRITRRGEAHTAEEWRQIYEEARAKKITS